MSFNNKAIEKMVKYFRQFTQIFCKKQIVLVLRWCAREMNIYFYGKFVNCGIFSCFF